MSPQVIETHLPHGYTLEPQRAATPRIDERPLLRDDEGRVLAVVEAWRPDVVN